MRLKTKEERHIDALKWQEECLIKEASSVGVPFQNERKVYEQKIELYTTMFQAFDWESPDETLIHAAYIIAQCKFYFGDKYVYISGEHPDMRMNLIKFILPLPEGGKEVFKKKLLDSIKIEEGFIGDIWDYDLADIKETIKEYENR